MTWSALMRKPAVSDESMENSCAIDVPIPPVRSARIGETIPSEA